MEMYTVSFFGHRIIDDLNKVQNELENIISKIVSEHEYEKSFPNMNMCSFLLVVTEILIL